MATTNSGGITPHNVIHGAGAICYAYARGYHDGRSNGTQESASIFIKDAERAAYRAGYDVGVTDFFIIETEAEV